MAFCDDLTVMFENSSVYTSISKKTEYSQPAWKAADGLHAHNFLVILQKRINIVVRDLMNNDFRHSKGSKY